MTFFKPIIRLLFFMIAISLIAPSLQAAEVELGLSDEELLDTIQSHTFDFFAIEKNKRTGMVLDRAHNFKAGARKSSSSIAATGFALTAYPVAVERGWLDKSMAYEITRRTLEFFLKSAASERGFFYHFLDPETGERSRRSELSPIDTALLLAGALFAAEYFEDYQISELAQKLYERVEWDWMLNGKDTLALAWSPEQGFNKRHWDHYDESMIMYLLAIGSPTHPIPAESWHAIARPVGSYKGYNVIQMPPLFTHQYSHIWIDFKNKNDGHADYFQNSVNASLANRAFCVDQAAKFSTYGKDAWGLTASDGPFGYRAYGAPPGWAEHDGTLAPTGCGSSIVFTPQESIACLRNYYENYGERLWGLYGFADSFNLDRDWTATDVIGIDQGALFLMIENYRTGFVWDVMKKNVYLKKAMDAVGFKEGTMEVAYPEPHEHKAPYVLGGIKPDGFLRDWPNGEAIVLDKTFKESGTVENDQDISAEIRFAWNEEALYFYAKVKDEDILVRKTGKSLWQDDLLELYIDPQGDGLLWADPNDFQIGVRADEDSDKAETYSWFQGGDDPSQTADVAARGFVDEGEYIVEGAIRWSYLGMQPQDGDVVRISPAIHDIDRDRVHTKLQWFFRSENGAKRFSLGKVKLEGAPVSA